jgi:hypothetical protein
MKFDVDHFLSEESFLPKMMRRSYSLHQHEHMVQV